MTSAAAGTRPGARRRMRLVLVGFWILPALVATLGFRIVPSLYNPTLGMAGIFTAQLLIWLSWGGWSLLIAAVSDRFPLDREHWGRALLAHIPLCVFVVSAQILVLFLVADVFGFSARRTQFAAGVTRWLGIAPPPPDPVHLALDSVFAYGVRLYGDMLVMVYVGVVGAYAAMRWYEQWRATELHAARIGEDLAQAQLQALRAQLNPHFLFNALNAIVTLIGRDPAEAQRTTVRLADLLRATLTTGDVPVIPFGQEADLTARYLEIERVRFPDRLSVVWEIPDALRTVPVPPFTLQPLVENAIRHAVSRNPLGGTVLVRAERQDADFVLTVRDDGAGPDASRRVSEGTGTALVNLRSRLGRAYGDRASLHLQARNDGGTDAVVRIPGVVTA